MTNQPEDLLEILNDAYRLKEQAELEKRESDLLLTGIRALLESTSSTEMFESMFKVLGRFIPYQEAFVLEQDSPGYMRCSTSTRSELESTQWKVDPVFKRTILGQPCAVYSTARQPAWAEHFDLFSPPMASALYCPFSGPDLDAILVFCHRQKGFYVQSHVHMAEKYKEFTNQMLLSVQAKSQALESEQLKIEKARVEQGLMQSDKMASLGLLAAGVAHEINNPVGYVTSNISYLSSSLDDLNELRKHFITLIEKARESKDPTLQSTVSEIDTWVSESSIADTFEDLPELIGDCQQGLKRIKEIVSELKSFAREDDDSLGEVDLNQCIESTLKLVSNELKYHCEITLKLSDIPPIQANEGKINQVLTNLLVNAGHAIPDKGVIKIATGTVNHTNLGLSTWFSVEDNGCGISPENLTRIFEPFYTSKDIGKGTGLGLSISYSIIEKLGGILDVESELNRGTKFIAIIPNKDFSQS